MVLDDEYDCTAVMNHGDIHLLTCCPILQWKNYGRCSIAPTSTDILSIFDNGLRIAYVQSPRRSFCHRVATVDLSAASPSMKGLLYSCSISESAEGLFIHDLVHVMGAATNMSHISCKTRAQFAVRYDLRNSYLCLCLLTSRGNVYTPRCLMLQQTGLF